jgi:hypothetical protein
MRKIHSSALRETRSAPAPLGDFGAMDNQQRQRQLGRYD